MHLLEANPDMINWPNLSRNPNALNLLEANPDKIDWEMLSTNPSAIHLLEANPDKIDLWWLSYNPNGLHLLEQKIRDINLNQLYLDIDLDQLYLGIDLEYIFSNPSTIRIVKTLLELYPDTINWYLLSSNPSIFEIDMKQYKIDITEKANIIDRILYKN